MDLIRIISADNRPDEGNGGRGGGDAAGGDEDPGGGDEEGDEGEDDDPSFDPDDYSDSSTSDDTYYDSSDSEDDGDEEFEDEGAHEEEEEFDNDQNAKDKNKNKNKNKKQRQKEHKQQQQDEPGHERQKKKFDFYPGVPQKSVTGPVLAASLSTAAICLLVAVRFFLKKTCFFVFNLLILFRCSTTAIDEEDSDRFITATVALVDGGLDKHQKLVGVQMQLLLGAIGILFYHKNRNFLYIIFCSP